MKVLLSVGAKFDHDDIEVTRELCIAANENDVERLRLWNCACVDMNQVDLDGRTPLHVVSRVYIIEKPCFYFSCKLFILK